MASLAVESSTDRISENIAYERCHKRVFNGHRDNIKQIKVHDPYILTYADDGRLKCWDRNVAKELWFYPEEPWGMSWCSKIFVTTNQSVVCHDEFSIFYVLSLKEGSLHAKIPLSGVYESIMVIQNRLFAHVEKRATIEEWDLENPSAPQSNRPIITPFNTSKISKEMLSFQSNLLMTDNTTLFLYYQETKKGKTLDLTKAFPGFVSLLDWSVDDKCIYIATKMLNNITSWERTFCVASINPSRFHIYTPAILVNPTQTVTGQGWIYAVSKDGISSKICAVNLVAKEEKNLGYLPQKIDHLIADKNFLIAIATPPRKDEVKIYFWDVKTQFLFKSITRAHRAPVDVAVYKEGILCLASGATLEALDFTEGTSTVGT